MGTHTIVNVRIQGPIDIHIVWIGEHVRVSSGVDEGDKDLVAWIDVKGLAALLNSGGNGGSAVGSKGSIPVSVVSNVQ